MSSLDLTAYFARIGYRGPRAATQEVLARLLHAQLSAMPFESLNPLLGRAVEIDPAALEAKLVNNLRGGYCFELNGLLLGVLEAIGFRVTPLAARVRWMMPTDAPQSPLNHMLLLVHLPEGDFLCDSGFGSQSPIVPLRFEPMQEQETALGTYRLNPVGRVHDLEVRLADGWVTLYRFDLEPQAPRDYEVFNWYTATHPTSRFVNNLVAARVDGETRITLLNREFGRHGAQGRIERRELESAPALHDALARDFHIAIERDEIERVWPRLPRPSVESTE